MTFERGYAANDPQGRREVNRPGADPEAWCRLILGVQANQSVGALLRLFCHWEIIGLPGFDATAIPIGFPAEIAGTQGGVIS